MYFGNGIWSVLVIGICLTTVAESVVVSHHGPLTAFVNTAVYFTWNSNVSVLEVVWGIRSGNSANPQYIYVDQTEGPVINHSLDASLRRRLHYIGDLAAGRAWFMISQASLNDSNTYIALIREKGSSAQVPYYVQVIVTGTPTTTPSPTPRPTSTPWPTTTTESPAP